MDYLKLVITLLVIVGAINWGLVAYNGTDLVTLGTKAVGQPQVERYVKLAVGAAGLYALYEFYVVNFQAPKALVH
jgi:uncharacterized membrane protein YuzA (DUF378 family)